MFTKAATVVKTDEESPKKPIEDQVTAESQANTQVAQQRVSFDYEGHGAAIDHHHYDDHHHYEDHHHDHHHDPGYWKKRVEWKLG